MGSTSRLPFQGEGHRKDHARLRILDGIRVSRTRVLRVMRAQGLLSPHRGRQGDPKAHDGTIVTSVPCVMWGTDGIRVFTAEDGWVWTFAAVDHWNAECVGWHVCKVGSRFAALKPIAQGLGRLYGSVEADVARGLARRMDHGSQYLSDHFLTQVRYWGIHPSFGFLEEPETNGVVERWNRTLKEQAIYGRVFQNLADVRAAVAAFVERYNQCWRLEKLAYRTPLEAREQYELRHAAKTCVQETGCGTISVTLCKRLLKIFLHVRRFLLDTLLHGGKVAFLPSSQLSKTLNKWADCVLVLLPLGKPR